MLETPDSVSQISPEQIRAHLETVLLSPTFSQAYRLRNFLQFIVESAITGEYDNLKESTIGVAVFEKHPSFDPRQEPIVRVQAGRLRAKLQAYYENEGMYEPIVIHLPKGAYVPFFEALQSDTRSVLPSLHVTPEPIQSSSTLHALASDTIQKPVSYRNYSSTVVLVLIVTVVLLTGAVLAAAVVMSGRNHAPMATHEIPLTSFPGKKFNAAISPDGKRVAFAWNGERENNYDIYVKLLNAGSPVRLTTNAAHDLHPAWSPDGQYIAFLRVSPVQTEVIVIPSLGGQEHKIVNIHPSTMMWSADPTQISQSPGPIWLPDGQSLIVSDSISSQAGQALFAISLDGNMRRQITTPSNLTRDAYPSLSPDGKTVAFVRQTSENSSDIFLVNASGGTPRQLTFDKMDVQGITWENSGNVIIFSSNRGGSNHGLWEVSVTGGTPTAIPVSAEQATDPVISPAGGDLAYTDTIDTSSIWRQQIAAPSSPRKRGERLISSSRRDGSPKYSPDGRYIVFTSDRSGSWEIWKSNSDGTGPEQITNFGGAMVGSPNWSPDGRWIIFDARPNGRSAIYTVPATGGTPSALTIDNAENKLPGFSNDGKWIFFGSGRNGLIQLWKVPFPGGAASQLSSLVCRDSFESPDGQEILFESNSPGIWKAPIKGGDESLVQGLEDVYPSRYMTVANGGIYFVKNESAPRLIERYDLRTHRIDTVGTIDNDLVIGTRGLTVSPDGKWVLYAQQEHSTSDLMLVKNFKGR